MKSIEKVIGKYPKVSVHLQHSSVDSFHKWITHSIHKHEKEAMHTHEQVVGSFPTHFKWRIIKVK